MLGPTKQVVESIKPRTIWVPHRWMDGWTGDEPSSMNQSQSIELLLRKDPGPTHRQLPNVWIENVSWMKLLWSLSPSIFVDKDVQEKWELYSCDGVCPKKVWQIPKPKRGIWNNLFCSSCGFFPKYICICLNENSLFLFGVMNAEWKETASRIWDPFDPKCGVNHVSSRTHFKVRIFWAIYKISGKDNS